jgi:hypothetical protein
MELSRWHMMENENYPARDVARALVPAAPGLLPALVLFRVPGIFGRGVFACAVRAIEKFIS